MNGETVNTATIFAPYAPRHAASAPRSALALARGLRTAIHRIASCSASLRSALFQFYVPRHAAPGLVHRAAAWCIRAARWIARKSDEPMTGAALCLCGAALGLFWVPVLLYCYFG